MAVTFDKLVIEQNYERKFLAELWGYKGFQAISKGVVTPSSSDKIVLFVTKEKQDGLTQFNDYIDGDLLHWEGESKHGSDTRIVNASLAGDEIHLFYRERHHLPFGYFGQVFLKECSLQEATPSQFTFLIKHLKALDDLLEEIDAHSQEYEFLGKTDRESIVKSRIGQGKFRSGVIALWGGNCAVSGLRNLSLLKASHIKPWSVSTNSERLDPSNGLLLQPTLDHLFDLGLVTFDDAGAIQISKRLSEQDIKDLGISRKLKLSQLHPGVMRHMEYHRIYVFA